MIGIIDYDMGNLGSVTNACRFLEMDAEIIARPSELDRCDAVILPGVGAFGDCMEHLVEHGFADRIRSWVGEGKPYLGMCLGLQVLFDGSEESPGVPGLGLVPGRVKKFALPREFKVPQIGWNIVKQERADCPLFKDVADETYFYFVHSFYVEPEDRAAVAGVTTYADDYASVVWQGNLMAVQFHPEKSQKDGLQMLKNYGDLVAGVRA